MVESSVHKLLESTTNQSHFEFIGVSSPEACGLLVRSWITDRPDLPVLIICPDDAVRDVEPAIRFFCPQSDLCIFPALDGDISQGLPHSPAIRRQVIHMLAKSQIPYQDSSTVWIVGTKALTQLLPPVLEFKKAYLRLKVGQELNEEALNRLTLLGYEEVGQVTEIGQFQNKRFLIDIFSPGYQSPFRIERFGNLIESITGYDPDTQLTKNQTFEEVIIYPFGLVFPQSFSEEDILKLNQTAKKRLLEWQSINPILRQRKPSPELDLLIDIIHPNANTLIDYLDPHLRTILYQKPLILAEEVKYSELPFHKRLSELNLNQLSPVVNFSSISVTETSDQIAPTKYPVSKIPDLKKNPEVKIFSRNWENLIAKKLFDWVEQGYQIFFCSANQSFLERASLVLNHIGLAFSRIVNLGEASSYKNCIFLIQEEIPNSVLFPLEKLVFLNDSWLLGKKSFRSIHSNQQSSIEVFRKKAQALAFGDLKTGDLLVHIKHGIGEYEGLATLVNNGIPGEFVQLKYRDNDRLYLPVYRIHELTKYIGPTGSHILDKLGGSTWQKAQIKVRSHLKEIALELLSLYAKRSIHRRPPYHYDQKAFEEFSWQFPHEETSDQMQAIQAIVNDLKSERIMDRLLCGDVGFGKTEIAMRAAFIVMNSGKQVALICPTTVLCLQHLETFKNRFEGWPYNITKLDRFTPPKDAKEIIKNLTNGKTQMIIGTHRLLSPDIQFKDLGLLIIDEEQKFGVVQKEKLKKLKFQVDTLALSATPIPRTLNLSLLGIRDLSLLNSPPAGRLPIKTFITRWEDKLIEKAIMSEIERGGQVFFVHNRIQSLEQVAQKIRSILPPTVRIKVAHGQLPEDQLEEIMLSFYKHEFDILVSTAIIESGIDVPRANTIFIDQPSILGLSQLYQLRGRVGRQKIQAYCYLLLPKVGGVSPEVIERLRILRDHTDLGSGIRIAQHDLELRGTGNLLGEDQSGHVQAVGYELYLELLEQAINEVRGQEIKPNIEVEIRLTFPSLIPSSYIPDIRVRMGIYKRISQITDENSFHEVSNELEDRFGPPPKEVHNLMGLSLIRTCAEELRIREISQGSKNLILSLDPSTPIRPDRIISLMKKGHSKYQIAPPDKIYIRCSHINWVNILEEIKELKQFCRAE